MGSFIYYNAKYVIISMSVTAKLVLIYASRTIEKAVMPKKTKKKKKKKEAILACKHLNLPMTRKI